MRNAILVPDYVADWYEKHKENLDYDIYNYCSHFNTARTHPLNEFDKWFNNNNNMPIETLARMKLDGYIKESNAKYRIILTKTIMGEYVYIELGGKGRVTDKLTDIPSMTMREIEWLDEKYVPFAQLAQENTEEIK